jgi:cystathionine gamma-lyase/cystathionine gamma-lyase/homocysteine desulfhydrase
VDSTTAAPVVTPLFMNSAFSAESPYFYSRKNNPNVAEFEQVAASLEEAACAVATTTGMSAIALVTSVLPPNAHVVLNKLVYGCTYKFFRRLEQRGRLRLTVIDMTNVANFDALPSDVDMVFFETPTNPFLKSIAIEQVASRTKALRPNAWVVTDNTWATPLFQRPLQHGADLSLYSATKFFSGHSDVMGGVIVANRADLADRLREERFYGGAVLDPHSAWLLRRSMQTFSLRMEHHQRSTREMVTFLDSRPEFTHTYNPTIDGQQLCGYGGIVFCELRDDLVTRYTEFANALQLFGAGTGMACVTSMVAQPYHGSHASMTPSEKEAMGLGPSLVRLCFGLESVSDLQQDLATALQHIQRPSTESTADQRTCHV